MKKLLLTIISSTVVASTAMANDRLAMPQFSLENLREVQLIDGRRLNSSTEVERVHLYNNKVDYLKLYNGEIVDRTDILILNFRHAQKLMTARVGVDSGG